MDFQFGTGFHLWRWLVTAVSHFNGSLVFLNTGILRFHHRLRSSHDRGLDVDKLSFRLSTGS
jgi:hypothetical protein